MDNINHYRRPLIADFYLLKPPKPLSPEKIVQVVVALMVFSIFAILAAPKLSYGISICFAIVTLAYFILLNPRRLKKIKYNSRISSKILDNWFLEAIKTKILDRAIEYLELQTKDLSKEQFIIIPYPVFNSTKKIKDESVLRVKTVISSRTKNLPEEFCYHYTIWNIQVLVLSQSYLSYYFCSYNFLTDEILNEKTNEYFYQDIALIKTEHDQVSFVTKWDENPITEAHITKLIHNSGDVLSLIAELPELHQPVKTIVDIEKVEKTIRFLIRHAKAKDESRKQVNINFKPADIKAEAIEL